MKNLVRDILEPKVSEAIRNSGILDDYTYWVGFDVMPAPQGPQPAVGILIGVPNPAEIGRTLTAMTFVPGPIPDDLALETTVLALINAVSEQRQALLQGGQSKLILPGS